MPLVRAFDKHGRTIRDVCNFHEGIVSMDIENNDSGGVSCDSVEANFLDYSTLSQILQQRQTRLLQISIRNPTIMSAEYLTFFVSTFQKTECLRLQDSLSDAVEFGCLVAGITQPGGLRELQLSLLAPQYRDLNDHMLLLLRGIAFASSLEKLNFDFRYRLDALRPAFIDAIQKNKSLKSVCLDLNWFADDGYLLPEIFKAAAQNSHIEDLSLRISRCRHPTILSKEVWIPSLCRRGCNIQRVCLSGIRLETDSEKVTHQNSSVKELVIRDGDLSCSDAMRILSRFKSLFSVDLAFNSLKGSFIFDEFLSGKKPVLQSLNLDCNEIQEADVETFIKRLPKLKTIKNLQLNGNPFLQSRACIKALEQAVLSNHASLELENVQYFPRGCGEKHDQKSLDVNALSTLRSANTEKYSGRYRDWERIMVQLSLNRFGRQHLLEDSSNSLPPNLWPLLLERASRLRYYSMRDEWKRPSLESTRVDVVYWLLREKVFV